MNLPWTYEKLPCKGELDQFNGQRDPSVQTNRETNTQTHILLLQYKDMYSFNIFQYYYEEKNQKCVWVKYIKQKFQENYSNSETKNTKQTVQRLLISSNRCKIYVDIMTGKKLSSIQLAISPCFYCVFRLSRWRGGDGGDRYISPQDYYRTLKSLVRSKC